MTTSERYPRAYDDQLRTDAETPSAVSVTRLGPLRLVTFAGGRGFITYRGLGEADGRRIAEPESIMIGALAVLCADVPVPPGVTVRRVVSEADVRAMSATVDEAFGEPVDAALADSLVARLRRGDGMELWVAETDGVMVCGGRLEPVPGTDFVGIWGGATLEAYRGRGIYRALTAARARSALERGKRLVHSDSTEQSRPILERAGLVKVSTTTPYTRSR